MALVIFSVFAALLWTCAKLAVPLLVAARRRPGHRARRHAARSSSTSVLIVVVGVLQGVGMGMRRYGALRMSYRVETNLRARLFAHLQLLHFAYHDEAQTGQLMAHANTDLYQISQWLSLGPISLSSLFILVGVIIVMVLASPVLALLALGALPLLNVLATRFSRRLAPIGLEQQEKLGDLSAVVEETVAGIRAVKGFGAEQLEVDRLDTEADGGARTLRSSRRGCAPASCPRSTSCPRSRSPRSSGTAAIRCSTATSRSATSSPSTSTSSC